jgi:threonine dehydratase
MAVAVPEKQGAFRELHSLLYPRTITEFSYRHNGSQVANIVVSFQALSGRSLDEDKASIKESFGARGFEVTDLSENEMAKSHARHLAGGRRMHNSEDSSDSAELQPVAVSTQAPVDGILDPEFDEYLYRFEFPEAPGALNAFFCTINQFNQGSRSISLLHYRNHGHDYGSVLVGLLVRPEDRIALLSFVSNLGYEYYDETNNFAYTQFLR